MYLLFKNIHIASVIFSISGFFLRGVLMIRNPKLLNTRIARIAPHIVDTILLLSAVILALNIHQYPLVHNWLTAKIFALLIYIILGAIALRYGKTKRIRILAFMGALMIFGYIVGVALTHDPLIRLG